MDNNSFNYTYSAKEQEEIQKIRKKYLPVEETKDKMMLLKELDAKVYSKATTVALILGIVGALIMGSGMSMIMTEISKVLGTVLTYAIGLGMGLVGIILVSLAYPIYNHTLKKMRKKYAPEVLRLSEELLK